LLLAPLESAQAEADEALYEETMTMMNCSQKQGKMEMGEPQPLSLLFLNKRLHQVFQHCERNASS
jgi:hypothetical protein